MKSSRWPQSHLSKSWCRVDEEQQPVMTTGDTSKVMAKFVTVKTRTTVLTLSSSMKTINISTLQMYSPLQSGLPQRQTESAGIFFLSHPSANQKNNSQLFKVYQWMQNHPYQSRGSTFSRNLILKQVPFTYTHFLFYRQKPQLFLE